MINRLLPPHQFILLLLLLTGTLTSEVLAQKLTRAEILQRSKDRGWESRGLTREGEEFELIALPEGQTPRYNQTLGLNAAISINAPVLHAETPPAQGAGVLVGIWDGGVVNVGHEVFNTPDPRVTNGGDTAIFSAHATAVTGVVLAAQINPAMLGIAPEATAIAYDWIDDTIEMAPLATSDPDSSGTIQLSNHSYGYLHGWASGSYSGNSGDHWFGYNYNPDGSGWDTESAFGRYGADAAELDQFINDHPYSMIIWAAGNDRNQAFGGPRDGTGTFYYFDFTNDQWVPTTWEASTAPLDDRDYKGGYDTMITRGTAKNTITVGSITDAVTGGVRDPSAASTSSFSCWGPTDDGRIKPDLVANGQNLTVPVGPAVDLYATNAASGTSFSAPGVTGAGALLVSKAADVAPAWKLRASTIKALLIHGATPLGAPGPNYRFGWGLVDVAASAAPLDALADPLKSANHPVSEGHLTSSTYGTGDVYTLTWDGTGELRATIVWIDPAGIGSDSGLDNPTSVLVNDLNLRIVGPDNTYLPWILDPGNPSNDATKGNNSVDTVEQVSIQGPQNPGVYTVTVTSSNDPGPDGQWYSLAISGAGTAASPAPFSGSINPANALEDDIVPITVDGGVYTPGTTFLLRRTGEPDRIPLGRSWTATSLSGTLDLQGAPIGLYDVILERPDGTTLTITDGFEIQEINNLPHWQLLEPTEKISSDL